MAQNEKQTSPQTTKISNMVTMIVIVVIGLSIAALFLAVNAYFTGDIFAAVILAAIGSIAIAMSALTFYQSKKQASEMKIQIPKVMTTIECTKCGTKNVREFQRGDYVFKELEPCQKCPETKQMITAIYKEVKEKEKTYGF
jgi:phosphate/sulfate permease